MRQLVADHGAPFADAQHAHQRQRQIEGLAMDRLVARQDDRNGGDEEAIVEAGDDVARQRRAEPVRNAGDRLPQRRLRLRRQCDGAV
ncbi:MAG: hypothetical protein WDN08_13730 [Rhizomicrobium sp.]